MRMRPLPCTIEARTAHTERVKTTVALAVVSIAAILLVPAAVGADSGDAGGAPQAKRPPRPQLLPASLQPLKIKGTRFAAGERVRLTVEGAAGTAVRRVRANRAGSFVVSFAGTDPCNGLSVRAAGDRGSRASFQLSSLLCGDS